MGSQLPLFKITKRQPFQAKFRCIVCGDSKKNKYKTRGHFFEHKGTLFTKCFNCSYSTSIEQFMKEYNPTLYSEYKVEKLADYKYENSVIDVPKVKRKAVLDLEKISSLHHNHPAKVYISNRKIPSHTHYNIFYAPKFMEWVNTLVPDKFSIDQLKKDEPRIILPFLDENNELFGFQGRSIDPNSKIRYITIMLDESKSKVFGLNTVNMNKKFYVTEGPIDSLFIDNCIAMAGSDIDDKLLNMDNAVIIYDNEPRNREIVKKIDIDIKKGYNVCLWPNDWKYKDINDAVMDSYGPAMIQYIIDNNTYNGLSAKMRFVNWKKI